MLPDASAPRSLDDWLRYQERLHPAAIELGLGRVSRVADRLGLRDAPPLTITVGGTNGKGSTTTLLALIYRAAGYRVGAYTSPHLFRYNERIAIDGEAVDDSALCRAFEAVEAARQDDSLTYFEFGTLAALWLFREAGVQVQVLEVGLGGRLDAVNILDADAVVITNIGLDHRDWLGDDRDAIGREKAGIARAGKPAIVVDPQPPAGLLQALQQSGAEVSRLDRADFSATALATAWKWRRGEIQWGPLPLPGLRGRHQIHNAAGALAAVEALQARLPVSVEHLRQALPSLRLAGRLQQRGRCLLDVAHNAEAAQALAEWLGTAYPGQRLPWLVGMLADKPAEQIAAALKPHVGRVWACSLQGARGQTDEQLAARLRSVGLDVCAAGEPAQALSSALAAEASSNLPILVCGSFLTIAAVEPLL